ncbi:hypothetical protein Dimus_029795 [Dionaea muscipula]
MTVMMMMKKGEETLTRQRTLRSSSIRSTTADDRKHHPSAIGCMAGIFRLISKYQNRRKSLTSGRKQEKEQVEASSTKEVKELSIETPAPPTELRNDGPRDSPTSSSQVQRNPTMTVPDMRRSSPLASPDQTNRSPRALMARLMGLDETPPPSTSATPESVATEKRRNLLGALKKCDEDLKAVKKLIEAVLSADRSLTPPTASPPPPPPTVSVCDGGGRGRSSPESRRKNSLGSGEKRMQRVNLEAGRSSPGDEAEDSGCEKKCAADNGGGQPSPVSVLDAFAQSPPPSSNSPKHHRNINAPWRIRSSTDLLSMNEISDVVNEAWGQRREVVKIGLMIQNSIYKALIDEIVADQLGLSQGHLRYLPFVSCKRKLF